MLAELVDHKNSLLDLYSYGGYRNWSDHRNALQNLYSY